MLNYNPFPSKSCSTTHLHVLPSNPMILKASPKHFLSMGGQERKRKINFKTAVSLLNLKTSLKFCFLSLSKCWKLILCIWNRRLCEVLNSQTAFWLFVAWQWPEKSLICFKKQFSATFPGVNGLKIMTEHATYLRGLITAPFHCLRNGRSLLWPVKWKRLLYVLMTSCSTSVT